MNGDDDKLLEQYLAGGSKLSRRYREEAGDDTPPYELDQRLRAAARREAGSRPSRMKVSPAAWPRALAAAAVIVLAVGLTLRLADERPISVSEQNDATGDAAPASPVEERGAAAPARQSEDEGVFRSTLQEPQGLSDIPGAAPAQQEADRPRAREPGADPGPEAWLERIRRLVSRGDLQTARESLTRFTERYPAHPVPDDLAQLTEPRRPESP